MNVLLSKGAEFVWINGEIVQWSDAKIHILTHSFHYSGAVFEGQRSYNGIVFKMQEHHSRLINSARVMGIELPYDVYSLNLAAQQLLRINNLKDAYIRTIAWVGSEPSQIDYDESLINVAIITWKWNYSNGRELLKNGLKVTLSLWRRPHPDTAPVHAKTSSLYAISILAKNDAKRKGFDEALFLDIDGFVADCTISNVFFVKSGELYTPKAENFLNGITRQTVISCIARDLGIKVYEVNITIDEISQFSEAFITGTAVEIVPIFQIDSYCFESNEVTLKIIKKYKELVNNL